MPVTPCSDLEWADIVNFLVKLLDPDHPLANPEVPRPSRDAEWHEVAEAILQANFSCPMAARSFVDHVFEILYVPERQDQATHVAANAALAAMEKTTRLRLQAVSMVTHQLSQLARVRNILEGGGPE